VRPFCIVNRNQCVCVMMKKPMLAFSIMWKTSHEGRKTPLSFSFPRRSWQQKLYKGRRNQDTNITGQNERVLCGTIGLNKPYNKQRRFVCVSTCILLQRFCSLALFYISIRVHFHTDSYNNQDNNDDGTNALARWYGTCLTSQRVRCCFTMNAHRHQSLVTITERIQMNDLRFGF